MAYRFNPFTGSLDLVGASSSPTSSEDNFSYITVDVGDTVTIPSGQEMVHSQDLMVRGNLMVQGSTFHIPDETASTGLSWELIPENKNIYVPQNRVLFYFGVFRVLGNLMIDGILKEVA